METNFFGTLAVTKVGDARCEPPAPLRRPFNDGEGIEICVTGCIANYR
jgi:hypothetical protein